MNQPKQSITPTIFKPKDIIQPDSQSIYLPSSQQTGKETETQQSKPNKTFHEIIFMQSPKQETSHD